MGDKIATILESLGQGATDFSTLMDRQQRRKEDLDYRRELLNIRKEDRTQKLADATAKERWDTFTLFARKLRDPVQILQLGQQMGVLDENGTRVRSGGGSSILDDPGAFEGDSGADGAGPFNATKSFEGFSYTPGQSSLAKLLTSYGRGGGGGGGRRGRGKGGGGKDEYYGKDTVTVTLNGNKITVPRKNLDEAQQITGTVDKDRENAAQYQQTLRRNMGDVVRNTATPVVPPDNDKAIRELIGKAGGAGRAYIANAPPPPTPLETVLFNKIKDLPGTITESGAPPDFYQDEQGVWHKK